MPRNMDKTLQGIVEDPFWRKLPYLNPYHDFLSATPGFKVLATAILGPPVFALFYNLLPRSVKHRMQLLTGAVLLCSAAASVLFLLVLYGFRHYRRRRQLALNASLADAMPEHFVLYLRSFRRSGALFVQNHSPSLADRRLMGNFWDIELALSLCLTQKLPLVSMGVRPDGIGSMQLVAAESSWRNRIIELAHNSKAIFLVLDERPSTLWEFDTMLADSELRRKLIVVMPPEQYGWWRRLRRLPTVASSWEGVRRYLGTRTVLPRYDPAGRLMLAEDTGQRFICLSLAYFHPLQIRRTVCAAIERGRGMMWPEAERIMRQGIEARPPLEFREGWRSYVDPIWPIGFAISWMAARLIGTHQEVPVSDLEIGLFALSIASLASLSVSTMAFTVARPTFAVKLRALRWRWLGALRGRLLWERYTAAAWFGLYRSPDTVRTAVNYFVLLSGIFVIRAMLMEPYKVPSVSMAPTLVPGDLILVNRAAYAVRLPLTQLSIWNVTEPKRGDPVVFYYPADISEQYLKRVIGLPGDVVEYSAKKLTVNGHPVRYRELPQYLSEKDLTYQEQAEEFLGATSHRILYSPESPSVSVDSVQNFPHGDNCVYSNDGFRCVIPIASYFVMGDNRDQSNDSRYWGFVPARYLIGKAVVIWLNFDQMSRAGAIN